MDVSVEYMGLALHNPIIVSSSGLTGTLEGIKKCADAGAGAVVLKSLFEEQIVTDKTLLDKQDELYHYYPRAVEFIKALKRGPGILDYLRLIDAAKKIVSIPVIGSINCISSYEWPEFAAHIEDAGADAIELNIALTPFHSNQALALTNDLYFDIITKVKEHVTIPIAVKTGYYFTNPGHTLTGIGNSGIEGMVLFNRFFQPDIDIHSFTLTNNSLYSAPEEFIHSLRWIALLHDKVNCDIAANTGIHDATAIIKELLAGATAVEICSALYKNGLEYIPTLLEGLSQWMEYHHFNCINDFKGIMAKGEDANADFERMQFMKRSSGGLV
jgi:dihydroorotate dehydrogenase (fumarate)